MKSSLKHETEEITPQVIKGEDVAKQYDWEKEFDKRFLYPFGDGTRNVVWSKDMESRIKTFIQDLLDDERVEAYKQGVHDEVKCIETSGEHGEAVEKIRAQERERVRVEIEEIHTELHNGRTEPAYRMICSLLSSLDELEVDKE